MQRGRLAPPLKGTNTLLIGTVRPVKLRVYALHPQQKEVCP